MIINGMLKLSDVGLAADTQSVANVSYLQTIIHRYCLVVYQVGGREGGMKPGHLQEAACWI